ncbi:unnamed protein product [Mytilus coruscus]|uniref:Uncharacterized protein n=1 Tax=Mytilus coruscus TaxID=42192 RepID=A0A6J8B9M2_MYTCO|nr:unnamed protein product [Mytilus coruscus]
MTAGEKHLQEENPSSSDDDEPTLLQGPPPAPRKSTSELAREAYEAVKESIDRGKQLEKKMDKCMDKFLSIHQKDNEKPRGTTGQSPNKKKKTQGAASKKTKTTLYQNRREHTTEPTKRQRMTLPEKSGSTDKETVPFQAALGSISLASGSDQPEMAGIDQNPVPRQHIATTSMFNNTTGLSDM